MIQYSKDSISAVTYLDEPTNIEDKGLGNLLVLYQVLKAVDEGALLLDDHVAVNQIIANERKSPNAVQFKEDERLSLSELIRLHVCTMAPDTALLLAKLYREQTTKSCQKEINNFVTEYGLTDICCKNISGRRKRNDRQGYTLNDIKKISSAFMSLSKDSLEYFISTECFHNGKLFKKNGHFIGGKEVGYRITWQNNSIVFDDQNLVIVLEAENPFELDQQLLKLWFEENFDDLSFEQLVKKYSKQKSFRKKNVKIVVAGDTYLGEWYSERRLKRNQWDPLNEEGYDYSFEKVQHFLDDADFSIANLEAVLVKDPTVSPMKRKKKFVLGAKAEQTAKTLKDHSIDLVTLATNHTNDFEEAGILSTLDTLKNYKISSIGSGHDYLEALCPYRVKTKSQDIFIFNGYWFRNPQYQTFGMYAQGNHLGGNCLSNQLFQSISQIKREFPDSKVIVICHWGIDFKEITPYQRSTARRIVEAGTDLIIGHGPHAVQSVDVVNDVDVLYSLGNFVFNSNGEFDTHPNALPFGMITKLNIEDEKLFVTGHFIYAENHKTKWQPCEVDSDDFNRIIESWDEEKLRNLGWHINKDECTLAKQVW
ncbi:CapA family protein [Enterococcus hulanensis]|uniref:CapA family protein n=1 Tax=Enterococcus hulanensis TaxID=2559929 RepID=UPI001A8FA4F3|nr:CapA family protein [Enterococcus hulanensis]MBO0459424.1 CapA family protein [Enterococcus hulanensis]